MKAVLVGAGVILAVAALGILFTLTRESRVADENEIRSVLAATPAQCRDLTRARMRDAVVRNGALSVRSLGIISRGECKAASMQLRAIG